MLVNKMLLNKMQHSTSLVFCLNLTLHKMLLNKMKPSTFLVFCLALTLHKIQHRINLPSIFQLFYLASTSPHQFLVTVTQQVLINLVQQIQPKIT